MQAISRLLGITTVVLAIAGFAPAQTATSTDGVEIAYEVNGEGEVALVMVHGWSCDRTYFRGQVPRFSRSYKVVTVDLAGHGESGLDRTDWTMAAFGNDVMAVVDALSLKQYVFVGHSLGALVVLEAASHDPEGLIAVVGLDAYRGVPTTKPLEEVERSLGESQAPYREDYMTSMEAGARRFFTDGADPELVDWVAKDMAANDPGAGLATWRSYVVFWNEGFIDALRVTKTPIIAINSDRRSTNLEALKEIVPTLRLELMKGVGHFLMMDDPDRFNEILDEILADVISKRSNAS